MTPVLTALFGHGKDLTVLQMGCRAFVMFFITLALIRISGMRSFGSKSAFDNIIVLMLGAILSRAVVGVSPVLPILMAGFVFAITHRIISKVSLYNKTIDRLVKGKEVNLYKNGVLNEKNLERCNLTKGDLFEGIRYGGNINDLSDAKEIYLEKAGHITVVK